MAKCTICKTVSPAISVTLGLCAGCIIKKLDAALPRIRAVHAQRTKFGLPAEIPDRGLRCDICANACRIQKGGLGWCGLTKNVNGRLLKLAGTPGKGLLNFYYDPHPTNCVPAWTCGATGIGYPKYSRTAGPEIGYNSMAVFYGACTLNCIFCQNWNYKYMTQALRPLVTAKALAASVRADTSCICFFGGDPAPQLPHAIATVKLVAKRSEITRFCLETNGIENPQLLKPFAKLSLEAGGGIKFDLKFWHEQLAIALTGVKNRQAYENFKELGKLHASRPEVPFLRASTLLIPGYVDELEVAQIAKFIASVDPTIPYSLLAFWPCYYMSDLPRTSKSLAQACYNAARKAGLQKVRIGNLHLLA
jgi:pyruvate formate lyase activating enzyme